MKALVLAVMAILASYCMVGNGAEEVNVPKVELVRWLEHGTSEGLKLKCTPDLKGSQEFFCELNRYRNGVEVRTIGVYAKQMKEILNSFFQIVPAGQIAKPLSRDAEEVVAPPTKPTPKLYTWDVAYGDKSVKGTMTEAERAKVKEMMRAVLSLEGALSSQFYR